MTTDDATAGRPAVEPWLREVLRCPGCLSTLADVDVDGAPGLRCTEDAGAAATAAAPGGRCGRTYHFDRGVPVLLVDEGALPAGPGATA
ncbi:hypothetical protein [Aquipuribacter sp. SD81]|uniref:hypothetical protein n=1 Tax=Aquipuribacter sp. SD81 TaxID=3127703 RepID=UPI0030192348